MVAMVRSATRCRSDRGHRGHSNTHHGGGGDDTVEDRPIKWSLGEEIRGMSGYLDGALELAKGVERLTTSWVWWCSSWGGGRLRDVLSCPLNQAITQLPIYHSKLLGTSHLAYHPAVPRLPLQHRTTSSGGSTLRYVYVSSNLLQVGTEVPV